MAAEPPPASATIASAIHRIQLSLLENGAPSDRHLLAAGTLLSRADYDDVVVERTIADLCGYPLCSNPLPSHLPHKGRFRVSLREHRVYDLEESYKYCSQPCLVASRAFAACLPSGRSYDLTASAVQKALRLFGFGAASEVQEEQRSSGKEGDLGFPNLSILEKEDPGRGEVSLEEWIGPANAVEGYVPHYELKKGSKNKAKQETKGRNEHSRGSELEFASDIVLGDESTVFSSSSIQTQDISEEIARKLENVVLEEKKTKKKTAKASSKSSKPECARKASRSKSEVVDFTSTIIVGNEGSPATSFSTLGNSKQLDFTGGKRSDEEAAVTSPKAVVTATENHRKQLHEELCCGVDHMKIAYDMETEHIVMADKEKKESALKSSLKTMGSKNTKRSVKWADDISNVPVSERKRVSENSMSYQTLSEEDVDSSSRFASAQACATALTEAAAAVSSGKSEVEDAVSEAGIFIMPQPQYVNEEAAEEDAFEFDRGLIKWPKKTVLLDTDMFEVEDSWHDTPPEGFNLTLSSFATMWMALFGWITCSTLAYVYGHDESAQDDFLLVNGREYPRKIVLKGGQSLEIRKTFDGCICRALPGIVLDLKLRIPISTLEKTLGCLLDTMSFVEALPSFKSRQWQVIVLLFLDALSVHRLPALAPFMANRNMLLNKARSSAQLSGEEYDSMIDLFLPLGRLKAMNTGF